MAVFIPELAGRTAPRYTSYPTAAEFHDRVGAADHAGALLAVPAAEPVSLYVHIPYCHEICWYCGCNTGATGRGERLGAYVDALVSETAMAAARCRGTVSRVHFGGGSPNALAPAQFARVAEAIRNGFTIADGAEWAVELDPRHVDAGCAAMLADAGVSRASLGVQTFDLAVQARINRLQPCRTIGRAVEVLGAAGIARLNFDLMYGLPGQTLDSIAGTIAAARRFAPDRVAMFGYAHLPQLMPRQRMIDEASLPDAAARFRQSALAEALWTEAGYAMIGFDHFARPADSLALAARGGRLRRNFQGFTDDPADTIIGLGASAISLFPGLIVQNEKHVGRYRLTLRNDRLPGARGVLRGAEDRLRAAVIERILCDGFADVAQIERRHARLPSLMKVAAPALEPLRAHGVVAFDSRTVQVTGRGMRYSRLIAAAFDEYRGEEAGRFSRAV